MLVDVLIKIRHDTVTVLQVSETQNTVILGSALPSTLNTMTLLLKIVK